MRKLFEIIRANDWWEYKFPPMLAIAYIILLKSKFTFVDVASSFLIILAALIAGAAYVSLINDATDVVEDATAGKPNKMSKFTKGQMIILVFIPVFIGCCFIQLFFNWMSVTSLFYMLSYLCFTLYSVAPFRLKKRGFAGILADACGSQLFPTLFISAYFLTKTNQSANIIQLVLIGVWLLCFGLRGILWHQLHDAKNDKKSGLITFVQNLSDGQINTLGLFIITVEVLCFFSFAITNQLFGIMVAIVFYLVFILFTSKTLKIKQTIIKPLTRPTRIFLFEFYQVFLPMIILCQCCYKNPLNIAALAIHIVLFPKNIIRMSKEIKG